jgi:transposase
MAPVHSTWESNGTGRICLRQPTSLLSLKFLAMVLLLWFPGPCCVLREAQMAWGAAVRIELSQAERSELLRRLHRRKIARADAMRAEIVLLAADGLTNVAIAERLGITRPTVATWRKRFAAQRLDGLADEPRPGAPRQIGDEKIAEVVTATLERMPVDATHWSTRSMAKTSGVSPSSVHRIWRAFSLQPHRSQTFKLSTDPLFVEKVRDIVGLYLNPPERALVLCVDEKTQIQALDRTQPILPMRLGQPERRTHDYERHGTTSLFAALDVKAGRVIGRCMPRHRACEFRRFLDEVEQNVPGGLDIHVVMDNASSHKTKLIRDWFAKRPRWHTHFTPTSSSWINQVERFFALLTEKQIRRGTHRSPAELEAAITAYIDVRNADPKPFRWTKSADAILAAIERFCHHTLKTHARSE